MASVLNSTSPIFVFLFTVLVTKHEQTSARKLIGALLGLVGVALIVGVDALAGLGQQVAGQFAAIAGAMLYACTAIYGKKLSFLSPTTAAAGTMIWASAVLIPASFVFESPLALSPSLSAIAATFVLAIACTGIALLLYFRLVVTLGSMGVASQAYLRAGVGVALGVLFLGEQITPVIGMGLFAAIIGVALINFPARKPRN